MMRQMGHLIGFWGFGKACERSNLMRFLPFSSSASSAQSVSKYHISLVISLLDELIMTSVTVTVVTVSVLGRYNFPILYIYTYISISYNIYIGDIVTQFFNCNNCNCNASASTNVKNKNTEIPFEDDCY